MVARGGDVIVFLQDGSPGNRTRATIKVPTLLRTTPAPTDIRVIQVIRALSPGGTESRYYKVLRLLSSSSIMKEIKYYVRIFFLKGSYMIIEGTYTLQATPEDVWRCLMDEQILRSAIPGLESLERLDNGQMSITMHISHRPLLGTFRGKAMVTEQQYPFSYAFRFEGDSNQSSLSGEGTVHLSERDENTIVAYKSSLNLGKTGVLLPPALVKGIAKHLIQEFFTELAEILRTTHAAPEVIEYSHVQITDEQLDEQSVTQSSDTQPTFLHRVVHRSGLGEGDPLLEELWVSRVKRYGTLMGLLLLVLLGTRLPRLFSH